MLDLADSGLGSQLHRRLPLGQGILALIVLSVLIVFQLYPTFDSYFIADDYGWLRIAGSQDSVLETLIEPSLGDWTTPVSNAVFFFLFKGFGFDAAGYYVVIALIHLLTTFVLYDLTRRVVRQDRIALVSASVFALHFIHFSDWGPLVWISAFVQLVVAFFYLASLNLFVRHLHSGKITLFGGALICFALAVASKETAVTLPLLILTWCIIGMGQEDRGFRKAVLLSGPFFLVLAVYLLYKFLFEQTSNRYLDEGLYGFGSHIVTNWGYFSNLIMPNPDSPPVHSFLSTNFPDLAVTLAQIAAGVSRIVLASAAILVWWKGPRHARLWIALSLITYLPFIGFARGYAGANRYFYLPAVGFSVLLATGFLWAWRWLSAKKGMVMSTTLLGAILIGFWGYNLVPIRAWQAQMRAKSHLRRQVVDVSKEDMARRDVPVRMIYLQDFPAEEIEDLWPLFNLLYGAEVLVVSNNQIEGNGAVTPDTLVLTYSRGRVVSHSADTRGIP